MPPDARTPPGLAPAGGALLNEPFESVVDDSEHDNLRAAPGPVSKRGRLL
jgi:hypothetical protein